MQHDVLSTLAILTIFIQSSQAEAITWEEQAERLQLIGASLVESLAVAEPAEEGWSLKISGSIPPTVNSVVGSKEESFPVPPVQAVPTVDWLFFSRGIFRSKVSLGILPPYAEKLVGMDARVYEILAGLETQWRPWESGFYFPLGFQWILAEVKGQLASALGDDRLDVRAYSLYSGIGWDKDSNWWGTVLAIYRRNKNTFTIAEDNTRLSFVDKKVGYQAMLGRKLGNFRLGLGLLYIPDRLMMPRIFASYRL